ncbi:MAG: hypothetical protein ACE5KY_06870 [Candidatus Tectimicrobiota bacterium]
MLDINFTLLIQLADFIILMFLLNGLLFKPIRAFVARRRAMIDQTLVEARSTEAEADETLERYRETLSTARRATDVRFAEAQAAVEQERRERLAEAERQAGETIAAATASIREAAESARAGLRDHAQALAKAITEKVLGRAV